MANWRQRATMLVVGAALGACSNGSPGVTSPVPTVPVDTAPPAIRREMRGLWIATVANIDWPTRTTLTADQQRAELVDIMNRASATGLNAIVFQIRPASDAVYQSAI